MQVYNNTKVLMECVPSYKQRPTRKMRSKDLKLTGLKSNILLKDYY